MNTMKINIETCELSPNAGAKKINNSGRIHPIIIHRCFMIFSLELEFLFSVYKYKDIESFELLHFFLLLL